MSEIIASKESRQKRLDICNVCQDADDVLGQKYCRNCGCVIALKVKFEGQECPIGKW